MSSPYFFGDVDEFMNTMDKIAEAGLFDVILIQPGTYFQEGKQIEKGADPLKIMNDLIERINQWNRNRGGSRTVFGLQFEMDMGLVTGRDDDNYSVRSETKRQRLNEYLAAVSQLDEGTPLGFYSGGPNEQGYSNIHGNSNTHNTGNYRVQDSDQSFDEGNGRPYSDFPGAYNGNLIYDINNFLFNRSPMSKELKDFLTQKGE